MACEEQSSPGQWGREKAKPPCNTQGWSPSVTLEQPDPKPQAVLAAALLSTASSGFGTGVQEQCPTAGQALLGQQRRSRPTKITTAFTGGISSGEGGGKQRHRQAKRPAERPEASSGLNATSRGFPLLHSSSLSHCAAPIPLHQKGAQRLVLTWLRAASAPSTLLSFPTGSSVLPNPGAVQPRQEKLLLGQLL